MYEGNAPYIFVSYSRADKDKVEQIIEYIDKDYRYWYDQGLQSSAEWTDKLAERIEHCEHFLVFLSANSVESKYVKREIHLADILNKIIHPVFLEPIELPGGLRMTFDMIQGVNYYDKSVKEFVGQLFPSFGVNCFLPKITSELSSNSKALDEFKANYANITTDGVGLVGIHCRCVKKSTGQEAVAKIVGTSRYSFIGSIQREYCEAESKILSMVNCPFTPTILDYFGDDNLTIVVKNRIDGINLRDVMRLTNGISESEAVAISVKVAQILRYFHESPLHIINRDIKPDNIMLDRRGDIHLVDMNVAKIYDDKETEDKVHVGTPNFAAPEQFNGLTDERTDIYGLGKTLISLLSTSGKPESLDTLAIKEDLKSILTQMTELDMNERYRNILDVKLILEDYYHQNYDLALDETIEVLSDGIFGKNDAIKEASTEAPQISLDEYLNGRELEYPIPANSNNSSTAAMAGTSNQNINNDIQISESTCLLFGSQV